MKKYEVTLYYQTNVTVVVEAEDEDDAIENAYAEVEKSEYGQQLLNNIQENDSPEVEEVE